MGWTYNSVLLTDLDRVRFLVQDTNSAAGAQLLQDEEILWVLGLQSNIYLAAADCCEVLAARFARQSERRTVGKLTIDSSGMSELFTKRAGILRHRVTGVLGFVPICAAYAGGLIVSEKQIDTTDDAQVQPFFSRDQFGYEGT